MVDFDGLLDFIGDRTYTQCQCLKPVKAGFYRYLKCVVDKLHPNAETHVQQNIIKTILTIGSSNVILT